ncbi:hypothetical protein DXG01_016075 [Tephrocybe rancida]|nr:hypothetical protein DXG01_016075 [Tephrocybe rancida]
MSAKVLLVIGATGKQGTALLAALDSDDTSNPFHVLALTRNPASPASDHLKSLGKHVDTVKGDLDDIPSLRTIFEDAKQRGGTIADLALEYGVSHFIYSSAERGGESYDDHWVLDRLAKVKVERHIRELGAKGLTWTILRPGFFMENLEGTIGSITVGVLRVGLKPDTTIQLIGGTIDVPLLSPEQYAHKILVVVSDILTSRQLQDTYKTATGQAMPSIPGFLARILIRINGHTQKLLADLERIHLMRIDPGNEESGMQTAAAREAYPAMTTFAAWAAQRQGKPAERHKGWNQVSIGRLIMGKQ